ncbi:hypothetical protein EXIGLDRAFT_609504 [Exidia glandulosa HHB12029]|uniref:P/Homo B domain-containing protein n=1 Tax=Exidia glandulosa HHB12029 TaxID=1314781 RepID=A0A165KD63_EXIGL|nr:hypothetical protein EXIGLDRAFT_609504 [Exidia glandulosa HHB12029]
MLLPRKSLGLFALAPLLVAGVQPVRRDYASLDYYVLEHDPSSAVPVEEVASTLGLEVVEPAGELRDHWLLSIPKSQSTKRDGGDHVLDTLHRLRSMASAPTSSHDARSLHDSHKARRVASSVRYVEKQHLRKRTKRDDSDLIRAPPPIPQPDDGSGSNPAAAAVAKKFGIKDPIFGDQWHLVNDAFPKNMMNVTPVWEAGVTGKGVIAAMVDDGLDFNSDDLAANFRFPSGSYDFNDHVPLPKPVLWDDHHGTRCAGEIAAVKNTVCGVGVAYGAKIAGLRILSGPISDIDEAAALNYGYQNTSIYSCSWGPPDDGKSMDGPSYLILKSMVNGVQNGRGGKGSIFVFASGNGAGSGDQCNFDGYTNSIFSVTVSAIDYKNLHPYYSEMCAANMIVTYSSGSGRHIHTTDVGKNQCSTSHGGTSAAAPIASGVFALALEARPDLSWRDIQHLCVRTAVQVNPEDPDWEKTAAGRPYSYKYGYGKLDAGLYVEAARSWNIVKPQAWLEIPIMELAGADMGPDGKMTGGEAIVAGGVKHTTVITEKMMKDANLETLEHITVKVWITHGRRGDVQVELVSPHGVKSVLAGARKYDEDKDGFVGWQFMTLKHWDEPAPGTWTLRVSDQSSAEFTGRFLGWSMTLWGASIDPAIAKPWVLKNPHAKPEDASASVTATHTTTSIFSTKTKQHPKPTDHLPDDHGHAEGEAHNPAFPQEADVKVTTSPAASSTPSGSSTPTPDEGYFSHMSDLLKSQTWLFMTLGGIGLFGFGAAIFFWRRRSRQMRARAEYNRVADDEDIVMRGVGASRASRGRRGGGTKELYDAFGEVSDEDDDADENARLAPGARQQPLGFHDGFLEDDDPASATAVKGAYRDNPLPHERQKPEHSATPPREGAQSPSSGSGDGSWEHASDAR